MYAAVFFYSDLSSDFTLVPHTFINLTGEKVSNVQLPFSCRRHIGKREDPGGKVDPCFDFQGGKTFREEKRNEHA